MKLYIIDPKTDRMIPAEQAIIHIYNDDNEINLCLNNTKKGIYQIPLCNHKRDFRFPIRYICMI